MVTGKMTWQVTEASGGGLFLAVFDESDDCIYFHNYGEPGHTQGQLRQDVEALRAGDDTSDWDGNSETPQDDYDEFVEPYRESEFENTTSSEDNHIVADENGIYPGRMGCAAMDEFGVSHEEHGRHMRDDMDKIMPYPSVVAKADDGNSADDEGPK